MLYGITPSILKMSCNFFKILNNLQSINGIDIEGDASYLQYASSLTSLATGGIVSLKYLPSQIQILSPADFSSSVVVGSLSDLLIQTLTNINVNGNLSGNLGDIVALPNLKLLRLSENNSASINYNRTKPFTTQILQQFICDSQLSTSDIDNLIIDLAASTFVNTSAIVRLAGERSSASDSAYATLASKCTLTIKS